MDKLNFESSTNSIPIATERQYNFKLVGKIEIVGKRMKWKTLYSQQNDTRNNGSNIC